VSDLSTNSAAAGDVDWIQGGQVCVFSSCTIVTNIISYDDVGPWPPMAAWECIDLCQIIQSNWFYYAIELYSEDRINTVVSIQTQTR
jgi:hypothetical protein